MITNVAAVATFLEEQVKSLVDIAVVGISGGVDSSVVASICTKALGASNVHVVSLPFDEVDVKTFNARSAELANHLKAQHHIVPIGESAKALEASLSKALPTPFDKLTPANIRPRIRMTVLYGISGELGYKTKKRVRVMGTGHMSEDLIGYDTKGGDALCDIFILSDLVKSEVYQLAKHYNVPKSIIEAAPSAGLFEGQTDADELGYDYDTLETTTLALNKVIKSGFRPQQITTNLPEFKGLDPKLVEFVVNRYRTHHHKHEAPVSIDARKPEWFSS